jgi:pimeloyl-ACP methyl ester carboxylesterase/DNA-binding CsgD family transcriptional regulator
MIVAEPNIRYARTADGVNIAYHTLGSGPALVYIPAGGNAGQAWRLPELRSWIERLAARRKFIRLDYRGIGLSDRGWKFSPELIVNDIMAVADKEGVRRFALFGQLHTAAAAVVCACEHPELVSHLILWCPYANPRDYFIASPPLQATMAAGEKDSQTLFDLIGLQAAGWADADQARRFAAYLREGASADHYLSMSDFDISPILARLKCRVLVMHRREVPFPTIDVARQVASNAPDAQFVVLEGSATMPFFGDADSVLAVIDAFLAEQAADAVRPDGLTEREEEILCLLAGGSSNGRIATTLTISARTVERHIGNIYLKIGAHNRAEATAYAFRHALVPPVYEGS